MSQPLMGLPRQPFKQSNSFPGTGENDLASQLFDQFCGANTFHGIMDTFQQLCDILGLHPVDHQIFYKLLKMQLPSWKAQSLWTKLDKRAANLEYRKGTACNRTRALIIGSGPCGLRIAIEIALLGGKAVVVEKREGFSRNNVLHLWPFLIHDLKALGAKKFFGKFCAGAIDHISIRALQCILLKVALLLGVEVHSGVAFEGFHEPPSDQKNDKIGWRAKVTPAEHPVSEFVFDVCISADGKRNTMTEFKRKEFRGKLAIAITANFINRNTKAEASVEEISGVAYIFNQKFFKDLNHHAGIDLENIVYYKDETHYFVMTAKKQSLLCKGVLLQDYDDPEILLSKENVDQHALLEYARQAADMSTQHQLPNLEFAHNHYGQPDVAMFDFTSMFAAEHACRVVERQGYRLLIGLVGDTLLEPFWPTGSGCARGFLGAFDAAWMIRSWASGKMTPLEVIAERESIYQLLSQTTPENLNKNYLQYTIDPNTRYLNLNMQIYKPHQVASQYDGHDTEYLNEIVRQAVQQSHRYESVRESHNLLKWLQRQLQSYQNTVRVIDLSSSWRSGMALCALIHHHRPDLLDVFSLDPNRVEANNQLGFDVIEKEYGVLPFTTGREMALCDVPDKIAMTNYLSSVCGILRKEAASTARDKAEDASNSRLISLTKIGNRIQQRREEMEAFESSCLKRFQEPLGFCDVPSKRVKDLYDANTVLNAYGRFENLETFQDLSKYTGLQKELRLLGPGVRGQNKVSSLAKDLASKLSGEGSKSAVDSSEASRKPQVATTDSCYFCKNRVYTVERYTAEGLLFHRGCFRCDYCGIPLRISYYSFKASDNGEGKFYCVQHHGLQRSNLISSGVVNSGVGKGLPGAKQVLLPPKVSSATGKETAVKKTPERVEYVTESEVEESEYEQTKHNLCSVLRPSAFSDSDSSSSEEELHFSDEEASDEQPDLSWAELARKYSDTLRQTKLPRLPHKRTSSASSGSETETVEGASDADWETDSNTDKENTGEENGHLVDTGRQLGVKQRGSRDEFSRHLLSLSPKQNIRLETKPSPTSVEIMRNRMAFFSTVSQPVRIDARAFLGLAPPPVEEPKLEELEGITEGQNELQNEEKVSGERKEDKDKGLLENRNEERPSKRRAEKKPVVQKVKKRTKRRKKEEKSRVTADVESTRLSMMHEAVPVVSLSGATSSDEQDAKLDFESKGIVEIPSLPEETIQPKTEDFSDVDIAEEQTNGKLEGWDELKERQSADEAGSSQSKSGGSQVSENSQTLQFSDSEEDFSPRGDLPSEAILESQAPGHCESSPSQIDKEVDIPDVLNGETRKASKKKATKGLRTAEKMENLKTGDEFEVVLRIDEPESSETKSDIHSRKISEHQAMSKENLQDRGDGVSCSSLVRLDKDLEESDDEEKLEHEYVVLEEGGVGDSETGKFSPYEELINDGSDKEYTKIQIKSPAVEETERELVFSKDDMQRDERLFVPIEDFEPPSAKSDSITEEDGSKTYLESDKPLKSNLSDSVAISTSFDASSILTLEKPGVHVDQSQPSEKPVKIIQVCLEENTLTWSEVTENLEEDPDKVESWPVQTEEVAEESNVHHSTCSTLEHKPGQTVLKVALEENIQPVNEVVGNLRSVEEKLNFLLKAEEVTDEIGVLKSECSALIQRDLPDVSTHFEDISSGAAPSMKASISSLLQKLTEASAKPDVKSRVSENLSPDTQKINQREQMLDPLSRINLLLESLSLGKTDPCHSDRKIELHGLDNGLSVGENGEKRERPTSLNVAEEELNSEVAFRLDVNDVVKRLAQQEKHVNLGRGKNQILSGNELSSDSSICNASTTSGSADFTASLQRDLPNSLEHLTSPVDESASDIQQGTSLPYDDGSSVDQLATGSLSEDLLSLENVAGVNVEGEELANLEVEVWPRVVLEDKSVGDQKLTKRLEMERIECQDINEGAAVCGNMADDSLTGEVSELKVDNLSALADDAAAAGDSQMFDQKSVGIASNSSTSSVLSPNRIMDAKRRFFFEPPQPLRIDPRKVFTDIPSAKQQVVANEVLGEELSLLSAELIVVAEGKGETTSSGADPSLISSGSETGIESGSFVESLSETQSSSLSGVPTEPSVSQEEEKKRMLPTVPAVRAPPANLPVKAAAERGVKPAALQKTGSFGKEKGKVQIPETNSRSKKLLFKEKKRPNSAFVVMEEDWKAKAKGSPVGLNRPISAKPSPSQLVQKLNSPVIGSTGGQVHVSQSDGASAEEASPSLIHKDKENRLKSFYQQKSKSKDVTPPADKKDKKKSLLALLIPSRSLEKKEKSTKSPTFQSKTQQHEGTSKPTTVTSMAVVREKTKSLPLEKKQAPPQMAAQEPKKMAGEKLLKGKMKSKPAKVTSEQLPDAGYSIYKEMAGIMEGIKKVEKRNRDKNSIRIRIEAVAPPPAKAPNTVLLPPKADIEDFETESEFGDDRLSLRSFQSQMHLLSEEEAAKLKKRQQKAARRKLREKELKRLHAAQEVQQQLEEVELRQREIEQLGVEIEKALNGEEADKSRDETSLVQQWFDIVYERNVLMRYESELMVQARELELEDRQSRLEIQLRERIPHAESQRTESLKEEEQQILQELMEVVEQRDALVALLEEDRIKQQQYSKNLERIMVDRGFQLSPISHIHLPQSLAALQEDR